MNPTNKGNRDFETISTSRSAPTKLKPFFVLAIGLAIPILAVVLSLAAWNFNERHPRTDDGVARANLIGVAPRVSGPIIKVNVSDNQSVKSGDLLFEIDPADFELAVEQAQAALASSDRQIDIATSQV